MPAPFHALTPERFRAAVEGFGWRRRVWRVDLHHTFRPDHARWRAIGSLACVEGMWRAHVLERGFDDIAQHVSIMPDGSVWTGRDWNVTPASVGFGLNRGVFMLETVGNFDLGCDVLEGAQLASVLDVIGTVQQRFALPPEALLFHREVPVTDKTCPGTGVSKAEVLAGLRARRGQRLAPLPGLSGLPVACG